MNIPQKLRNRLRKLKELAERGVDGERDNAREIYQRLLKENGLTDADVTMPKGGGGHSFHREPPKKRRPLTEEEKAAAEKIANDLRSHIDAMYPGMWENVPKTARTSVRNHVYNSVVEYMATH